MNSKGSRRPSEIGSCLGGNRFRQCDMKKRKYTASLETEHDKYATERESYRQEGFLRSILDIQKERIRKFELQNASEAVPGPSLEAF